MGLFIHRFYGFPQLRKSTKWVTEIANPLFPILTLWIKNIWKVYAYVFSVQAKIWSSVFYMDRSLGDCWSRSPSKQTGLFFDVTSDSFRKSYGQGDPSFTRPLSDNENLTRWSLIYLRTVWQGKPDNVIPQSFTHLFQESFVAVLSSHEYHRKAFICPNGGMYDNVR